MPDGVQRVSACLPAAGHTQASPVPSPCTGVCLLQSSSGYCQGCLRTLDEIASWGQADEAYKRAVLVQLAQRELKP
jgi:uncharacterized protein